MNLPRINETISHEPIRGTNSKDPRLTPINTKNSGVCGRLVPRGPPSTAMPKRESAAESHMSFLFAQRGNARPNNVSRRRGPTGHHSRTLGEPAIVQGARGAHAEASPSRSCAARGCVGATGHGQGIVSGAAPPFMKDETSAGAQFEYGAPLLRSDAIDTKRSVARAGSGEVEQ
jgi:hypothetical protein